MAKASMVFSTYTLIRLYSFLAASRRQLETCPRLIAFGVLYLVREALLDVSSFFLRIINTQRLFGIYVGSPYPYLL